MPLTRYHLRNEYSLADPDLYRAADKDDPEALLEGVAMAALVGVLRQLGDLAEFAAEIFHNLHEEVMTTAARGHGLTLRVQQLEAEFPLIEKAFLSQTSHSLFLHNSGVDWHPNLRLDQNLITQGDLPRFVMDSYEESRGPPRLFLLDKFDIAGAGACLKRYTDPSFFKAEFTASEAVKEEVKRDKKSLKIKKKGSRWRTRDNPEVTASHSKLHQLLLEERCQSQNNVHTHHVKLKRRHSNNSLVNSNSGKSYMERFLTSHSSDSKFVCGSFSIPSRLKMGSSNISGLDPESEIRENSPANELIIRDRRMMISLGGEEKVLKPSLGEFGVDVIEERNSNKLLESAPEIELESIPSTFYKVEEKKELLDVKGTTEANAEGYHSDDANSEIDNYADALTTMDSETDTESKSKNEPSFKIERKCVDCETNEEQKELQAQFSDSQSIGSSVASEDGIDSLEKGRFSSSYSDTFSDSTDNIQSHGDLEAKSLPSTVSKIVDISSKKTSGVRNASVTRSPEHSVLNGTCNNVSEIPSYSCSFREASFGSDVTNLASVVFSSSPKESFREVQLFHPNSLMITSDLVDSVTGQLSSKSENDEIAGHDLSCMTNVSDAQSRHDFLSRGSRKSQTVGILDGGNVDALYDVSMNVSNILGSPHEVKDDDDIEETLPTGVADDSHYANQMIGKLDSPDSVLFNTETELYGLAEQDLEAAPCTRWAPECRPNSPTDGDMNNVSSDGAVVDLEEDGSSGGTSEYLTSVVTCPETGDFREQNDPKITGQALSLELDTKEVGIGDFEVGASGNTNNMEFNMSDYDMKDGHAPDGVHFNSSSIEKNSDISRELPFRSISNTTKSVSATEVPLLVAGSETTNVHSKDAEDVPIGSSNGDVNQDKLETTGASAANTCSRSNAEKEMEKRRISVTSDYNSKLCNLDGAYDPLMVECTQTHMDLTEGTGVASLMKVSDQKKELKQPLQSSNVKETSSPSTNTHEAGVLLEEDQEIHAREDTLWPLQQKGESAKSPYQEYELAKSPNHMFSDGCSIAPSKYSSMNPLNQPTEISFLSPTTSYKVPEPSVLLQPIFQASGLPAASNQQMVDPQPHSPILDISQPDNNDVQDGVEEMPPLPPLPPMQWRIGKIRHDSPMSGGEMTLPSFDASSSLLADTTDWIARQDFPTFLGELVQPLNPSDAKNSQHGFQMLGNDVLQPSLSSLPSVVPDIDCQDVQMDFSILEPTITKPMNPLLPPRDGDLQHGSSNSVEEIAQQTSLNPFTAASTTEDLNTQCVSLTSQVELEQSLDSSAPIKHREDEKLHHTFLDLERAAPATIGNEKHGYDSQTLEGELKWQSNLSAVIPTVDYGKPIESLKSRLSRPRDPLIEAVASHDKSNLRKATARILPKIGQQVDERNSLLEQIRTKSFNLKPAVATRPSVQGPKTNLKVVAILEKANAIRQALAGSDEDDEDSWSDS